MLTNKDLEKLTNFFYTKKETDERFEKTDERFKKIDERFDEVDAKFKKIDERFDKIDVKFEETNRHFDVVAEEIKNSIRIVAEQVSANTEKLAEYDQKIETVNTDISFLKSRVAVVSAKIKK